jgi:hypothetical protein
MSEQKRTPAGFPESEGEGTDGRGSPGIVQEKNLEADPAKARPPFDFEGSETDGRGSPGILGEGTREARAGETGTTRFGMEGSDTDGPGSGGILDDPPVQEEDDEGPLSEPQ